ncbi:ATP4 subunit B of the stator stalk of mitochondrial F1F0 ATP synthase [Agaricus bisporus var. bisporus H97]|uniref:ATP4 subunit B of the stator stalk of mitochondrial F1F0 ATP synthase n=1 Tax=Agaricus bisporus var. bisporus (strain H97 / ATCC MYA-4626 / FGSC 10389) TaxID=936046 RepID=UPI00029F7784|nr:ATP4 subunit B of the stator stalk of mitochondrial F1F0 ATP synthase [Agaricus bisporus var. bisporus H97]EKV43467.1 ATP4 subunit B of the stator stalk of mitochondrial F1F0 ATP synthase [Agaricus bisporus var. bisporus H97]
MASVSRIATSSLRAALRPRAIATAVHARGLATPPSKRAEEIVEKLPSKPGLITKTGTALLGTGLLAATISNELYVVNEETILLIGSVIVFTYLAKVLREPYTEWADGHIQRIKKVLDTARAEHTQAVQDRIDSVGQMKDAVSVTKALFSLSKETAKLESETFVQKQNVAMASELKTVLDSWVRYEQQLKESEQVELTQAVIAKVLTNIREPKTQQEILTSAIIEIEQLVKSKAI